MMPHSDIPTFSLVCLKLQFTLIEENPDNIYMLVNQFMMLIIYTQSHVSLILNTS